MKAYIRNKDSKKKNSKKRRRRRICIGYFKAYWVLNWTYGCQTNKDLPFIVSGDRINENHKPQLVNSQWGEETKRIKSDGMGSR